jgi:hypothetical protein
MQAENLRQDIKSMIIDNWAGKFRGILEIRGFE